MADLTTGSSGYSTGATDTWTTLVNNVTPTNANQANGLAAAILQIESVLGSGTNLIGGMASLAARLAVQVGTDGIIIPPGSGMDYFGPVCPPGWLFRDGSAVSRTAYPGLYTAIGTTHGAGDGSTTFNLPDDRSRVTVGAGTGIFVATASAANVDASANTITTQSNVSLYHSTPVVYTTSGTSIGGLTPSTTYYVIRTSATVIKLATSAANAMDETAIDLSSAGTGTHTFTVTYTARSLGEKGGEEAHASTVTEGARHQHNVPTSGDQVTAGGTIPSNVDASPAVNVPTAFSGDGTPHNNMMTFLVCNKLIKT